MPPRYNGGLPSQEAVAVLLDCFNQKLPMPTIEQGVCFDLWTNTYACSTDADAPTPADRVVGGAETPSTAGREKRRDSDPKYQRRGSDPLPCAGPFAG